MVSSTNLQRIAAVEPGELPPCMYCGLPVDVEGDFDVPAVCEACLAEARGALERARDVHAQAGAQFVGRERGTRDDVDAHVSSGSVAARLIGGGHVRRRR